jgi:hypothetical protein
MPVSTPNICQPAIALVQLVLSTLYCDPRAAIGGLPRSVSFLTEVSILAPASRPPRVLRVPDHFFIKCIVAVIRQGTKFNSKCRLSLRSETESVTLLRQGSIAEDSGFNYLHARY